MPCPLFIITPYVDHKLVNRLLLHLRDWEYGEDPTWDCFKIITSESFAGADGESVTKPPITVADLSNNIWASKSISDVEAFVINERNKADEGNDYNLTTFTILDEQSVKDGTIIVLHSPYDGDEDKVEEKFYKVRVPWDKAYLMWCNLDIGNMDFEDFVEDTDESEDDWWTYNDISDGSEAEADGARVVKEKRDMAIAELTAKEMA